MTKEQVSRWLSAWSIDQAFVGRASVSIEAEERYMARAEALADAAKAILEADLDDLSCFAREDGTYPEPLPA